MRKILIILLVPISNIIIGQTTTIIDRAKQLGKEWKFDEALDLLENNDKEKAKQALEKMQKLMPESLHHLSGDIEADMQKLKEVIENE